MNTNVGACTGALHCPHGPSTSCSCRKKHIMQVLLLLQKNINMWKKPSIKSFSRSKTAIRMAMPLWEVWEDNYGINTSNPLLSLCYTVLEAKGDGVQLDSVLQHVLTGHPHPFASRYLSLAVVLAETFQEMSLEGENPGVCISGKVKQTVFPSELL